MATRDEEEMHREQEENPMEASRSGPKKDHFGRILSPEEMFRLNPHAPSGLHGPEAKDGGTETIRHADGRVETRSLGEVSYNSNDGGVYSSMISEAEQASKAKERAIRAAADEDHEEKEEKLRRKLDEEHQRRMREYYQTVVVKRKRGMEWARDKILEKKAKAAGVDINDKKALRKFAREHRNDRDLNDHKALLKYAQEHKHECDADEKAGRGAFSTANTEVKQELNEITLEDAANAAPIPPPTEEDLAATARRPSLMDTMTAAANPQPLSGRPADMMQASIVDAAQDSFDAKSPDPAATPEKPKPALQRDTPRVRGA